MARKQRRYPPEFRQEIVALVRSGRSPEALAREIEPSASAIRKSVKQADLDEGRRNDGLMTFERQELRQARREIKRLRMERDILKKAAAWFARESDSIPETAITSSESSLRHFLILQSNVDRTNGTGGDTRPVSFNGSFRESSGTGSCRN